MKNITSRVWPRWHCPEEKFHRFTLELGIYAELWSIVLEYSKVGKLRKQRVRYDMGKMWKSRVMKVGEIAFNNSAGSCQDGDCPEVNSPLDLYLSLLFPAGMVDPKWSCAEWTVQSDQLPLFEGCLDTSTKNTLLSSFKMSQKSDRSPLTEVSWHPSTRCLLLVRPILPKPSWAGSVSTGAFNFDGITGCAPDWVFPFPETARGSLPPHPASRRN